MATERLFPAGRRRSTDFVLPLLVTPFMFICGDLLPKNLFFNAPNRLMRRSAPLLVVSVVLFAPITFVLWLLSLVLKLFVKEGAAGAAAVAGPPRAERDADRRPRSGHPAPGAADAGPNDARRRRAPGAELRGARRPRGPRHHHDDRSEILRIAQGRRRTLLPIEDPQQKRRLVGFVRTIDLFLDDAPELPPPRPLVELAENETFLSALGKLRVADDALGHVVNAAGKTVGFVTGAGPARSAVPRAVSDERETYDA